MKLARTPIYTAIFVAMCVPGMSLPAHAETSANVGHKSSVAAGSQADAAVRNKVSGGQSKTHSTQTKGEPTKEEESQTAANSQHAHTLQSVIVTGVPTVSGVTVKHASFLATSMDREQIKLFNPINSDDLLRAIPGVFPEPTGGKGGNNVDVAGYPPGDGLTFLTYQIEGMPVWPIYQNKDVGNFEDSLIRFDDTISRFQSIQGGPSVVSANGQPGITVNLLLRQGTPTPSGDVGVTLLSEGGYRFDGFVGGPVGNTGWMASAGGFLLKSQGVRDSQYPADEGGQFTLTLSKQFTNSSVVFYGRRLDMDDQFVTDTPLLNPKSGEFKPFPGFDPSTGTFSSEQNRYVFLPSEACYTAGCVPGGRTYDLAQGHGAHMTLLGFSFKHFGTNGWSYSDGFQYMRAYTPEMGIFSTSQNPSPLGEIVPGIALTSGFKPGTYSASAILKTGQPADLTTSATVQSPVVEQNFPRSVSDEFKVSRDFNNGDTLSGGVYAAAVQSSRFAINAPWRIILQAKTNPTPIVVSLHTNDGNVLPLTNPQGVFSAPPAPGGDNKEKWHEDIVALFVSDTLRLQNWILSGGARVAYDRVHGKYHLTKNTDMDANPNTLFNNFGQVFLPATKKISYKNTLKSGFVGATYLLNDDSSVYGNVAYGVSPNHFDTIRHVPQAATVVQTIHSYTLGYKFGVRHFFASIQAYHREFAHGAAVVNLANGGAVTTFGGGQRANGVLMQLRAGPFHGFSVAATADTVDGRVIDPNCQTFVNQAGNEVCHSSNGQHPARQPNFEYTIRPRYRVNVPFGYLQFWAVFDHVGYHTARGPLSPLGIYNDIGVGAQAGVGKHWLVTLRGTNVTDEIGLTEGNARIVAGAQNARGIVLARGIPGHEYNLQIKYQF